MLCLAAISVAATAQYSVSGYVYYFGTNKPVPKTYVQALDKNADFKTAAGDDASSVGFYQMNKLLPSTYLFLPYENSQTLTWSKPDSIDVRIMQDIVSGKLSQPTDPLVLAALTRSGRGKVITKDDVAFVQELMNMPADQLRGIIDMHQNYKFSQQTIEVVNKNVTGLVIKALRVGDAKSVYKY